MIPEKVKWGWGSISIPRMIGSGFLTKGGRSPVSSHAKLFISLQGNNSGTWPSQAGVSLCSGKSLMLGFAGWGPGPEQRALPGLTQRPLGPWVGSTHCLGQVSASWL